MRVYELTMHFCFFMRQPHDRVAWQLGRFIQGAVEETAPADSGRILAGHFSYIYDLPSPREESGIYRENKIYSVRIRTMSEELALLLCERLAYRGGLGLQSMDMEYTVLRQESVFRGQTLTPIIVKTQRGYWQGTLKKEEYEELLRRNLVGKYYRLTGTRLTGDFHLFDTMEFTNRKPMRIVREDMVLLADKISFLAADNRFAQELLYMATGTGLGHMNTEGYGFLECRSRHRFDASYLANQTAACHDIEE